MEENKTVVPEFNDKFIELQITQLTEIKTKLVKLFLDTSKKVQEFDAKKKNAKHDYSKNLYHKKVNRYKEEAITLLKRANYIEINIARLHEQKNTIAPIKEVANVATNKLLTEVLENNTETTLVEVNNA